MRPPLFRITLEINGTKYASKGKTMLEALETLPKPEKIFHKGKLTVKGKKERSQLIMPPRIKRLFYPLAKVTLAKQLELLTL